MNRRTIVCAPEFPEGASGSGEPSEIERRADEIIRKDMPGKGNGFPGISAERERELLGGCYFDESKDGLDKKMREFSDLQKRLDSVGSPDFDQSHFYNMLHRITDFMGISSPEKRYRKTERQIANNLNTVCRMVEDSRRISKNLAVYIEVQRNSIRCAGQILSKYEQMGSQLKDKLKDTAIPEEERDMIAQDLDEVCHMQESAAKAVNLYSQAWVISESTKFTHEKLIPVLKKLKESLYSKLDSIKPDSLYTSGSCLRV